MSNGVFEMFFFLLYLEESITVIQTMQCPGVAIQGMAMLVLHA